MAIVLLDLWGVVCDHEAMDIAYRLRMSEFLQREYGGDRRTWLRAHDEAYPWYVSQIEDAARQRVPFRTFFDRLDAEHIGKIFSLAGVPFSATDPLAFSRELESRVIESASATYPDVPKAVGRLHEEHHRVFIATQAAEWNASAAIRGAGLQGVFDGLLTGYGLDAFKSDPQYWERALGRLDAPPADVVVVDDSLTYLEAAAAQAIPGLLLDRLGAHPASSVPPYVRAVLRHLAALPQYLRSKSVPL